MALLPINSTYNRSFLMVSTADHITGSTGLSTSLTVTLFKAGSTSGVASTGVITEQGFGWYNLGMTLTDLNTQGDLTIHASAASGADPTDWSDQVSAFIGSNLKKNQASTGFLFVMTDSVTHAPKTGLTVTASRSIDGSTTWPGMTNAVAEVGFGTYRIDLSTADTNGNHLMYRFAASGADDTLLNFNTQP